MKLKPRSFSVTVKSEARRMPPPWERRPSPVPAAFVFPSTRTPVALIVPPFAFSPAVALADASPPRIETFAFDPIASSPEPPSSSSVSTTETRAMPDGPGATAMPAFRFPSKLLLRTVTFPLLPTVRPFALKSKTSTLSSTSDFPLRNLIPDVPGAVVPFTPLMARFLILTLIVFAPESLMLIPDVPAARMLACVPRPSSVIDFVIVTVPKPPGSSASISPPAAVFEIAPANVLQGAVRLHGFASSPTPDTHVRVASAKADGARPSAPRAHTVASRMNLRLFTRTYSPWLTNRSSTHLWQVLRRFQGGPSRDETDARSAERWSDVNRPLVLDGHEGRSDAHDQILGVGEQIVTGALRVVAARDRDADLVDRLGVEPGLPQLLQEPVAIGDPRGLDLHDVVHARIIPYRPGRWRLRPNTSTSSSSTASPPRRPAVRT